MNNNQTSENKKSNVGLIIIIVVILLLLFAIWFFLLRNKGTSDTGNNTNNDNQQTEKQDDKLINNSEYEYDYKDGVLVQIVDKEGKPKQTDFVIDGIILIGNRHKYYDTDDTKTIINNFVKEGYKKEGINSSFYLNEYIEFYIDTKYKGLESDVKIFITPHKTVEELGKMTLSQLIDLANEKGVAIDYRTPDTENYKFVDEGYISIDYPEGKYDILFTYKGKLAYFINITEIKEPTE